jgi:hypothetical protein
VHAPEEATDRGASRGVHAPAARPAHPAADAVPAADALVRLQRSAGNAAVSRLVVQRLRAGPGTDPKFAKLRQGVDARRQALTAHRPPTTEASSAQAAAKAPPDDKLAQGKVAQSGDMAAAKPGTFDKAAFIKAVDEAIAQQAPKNLDEADKYAESGKADQVRNQVGGQVSAGKQASARDIGTATTAAPDESRAVAKPVTPMSPDRPPAAPGAPDPAQAVPDPAPASATDFSGGPRQVTGELAAAQVTDGQLAHANEPAFTDALTAKKAGEAHAASAPGLVRGQQARTLAAAKADAAATGTAAMGQMATHRVQAGARVGAGKEAAKGSDEAKRAQVTAILQKVFDATKTDVEQILSGLDKKVDEQFTREEKQARDRFTRDYKTKVDAYKDKRYSGWTGGLKWAKDKLFGLPGEVNQYFDQARAGYVADMRQVISRVADTVGAELGRAKQRIVTGRADLRAAVDSLAPDLKAIGRQAAADFAGKFDELNSSVDAKAQELVQTLATKYSEALKSVDAEIDAEREKNQGLVAKAVDAVKGVIGTILELKNLLLGILAKAASAVLAIIKDPIGFLGKLVHAVGAGLRGFIANIVDHLKKGVVSWLMGAMASAGLQLPDKFDVKGIITLIANLLGLTWQAIRGRVVSRGVPDQAITAAEQAVPEAQLLQKEGLPGLWQQISRRLGDLKASILGKISAFLIPTVLIAGITWIISLLNPASAFVKAAKAIIDIVQFIVERGAQIVQFVNAVLDAILAIAGGGAGGVPALVETALAVSIPVLIGALAALLGVGGLADKVKGIIQSLAKPVMKVVDWVVDKIVTLAKKLWAKLKSRFGRKPAADAHTTATGHDAALPTAHFATATGEQHNLGFGGAQSSGATGELTVHSTPITVAAYLSAWESELATGTAPEDQRRALASAQGLNSTTATKKRAVDAAPDDAARQAAFLQLRGTLNELATALAKRAGTPPPLPAMVMPPFVNGVMAGSLSAHHIPKDVPRGQDASANRGWTLRGWSYVNKSGLNPPNTTNWVKMHLLPFTLGGMATDSNLVPARAATNTNFNSAIEEPARTRLDAPDVPMIWYEVTLQVHVSPGGRDELTGFLKSISVSFGEYEVRAGHWARKPATNSHTSPDQEPPADPGTTVPLNLNTVTGRGWKQLSNLLGPPVDEPFAQLIIDVGRGGPYADLADLEARVRARHAARKTKIPDFESALGVLRAAVGKTITFTT